MNEEFRQLEAEAIEVEARITGLIGAAGTASDTDGVRLEDESRATLPTGSARTPKR